LTKQLVWMTRSFDWNLLKPREKTSATRPSWPRGTRLDICQIIKNQEKFSVLSVPLVTNRHSQWTVKIRQKKFAKYTMTEWENKTKSTSIQVSRRGPNPWRVFFNGINYGKIISPPSNIQQEKVPLNQRGPLKKMIHPYQLCKYQRFIKKSLQWFFWIFEIFLKPKYWVQNVL